MRDINRVLLIGVLILPFVAFAKSGTTDGGSLAFKGLVVAAPCSVKADDITKTVEMGQVRSNSFPSKGTWDDAVAFQLHLEDCDISVLTTVAVRFEGISDPNDPQVFQTGYGVGAARGVGLGIFDYTGRLLIPNTQPKNFFPLTEGKTVLHFSAKYRSTLNYVQPGDASSTVQFKMIYQ